MSGAERQQSESVLREGKPVKKSANLINDWLHFEVSSRLPAYTRISPTILLPLMKEDILHSV